VRIALLHYSGPPTIGGVEQTIFHHARILSDLSFDVCVVVGTGSSFDDRVPVTLIPEMYSKNEGVLAAKAALDRGQISHEFTELRSRLTQRLAQALEGQDVLVVHNALSLHKNLPLTAALWDLHQDGQAPRIIGWHHDLAWDRPDYRRELHPGDPWQLLCRPWPGATHVVVSRAQQARLARVYGIDEAAIHVVPPGVDPPSFERWTPLTCRIVETLDLPSADLLLLLPARITRRKNIEYALHTLAALRRSTATDCRLIVTGPPGPHNPTNAAYLDELLDLRTSLGIEASAHFLFQLDGVTPTAIDPATLADLYRLSDALFFPSRDEGFGIPLLEAALARLPVFCSDIPPFHESGGAEVHFFSLEADPADTASLIANRLSADPALTLRRRTLQGYTWRAIVRGRVVPLLELVARE
jgi:glycosyltransferase involved in cell wall biosynthesis